MPPAPSPGAIARVRQRLYLVEDTVAPTTAGDSTLVRLSCVDDDNQGQPLDVLWERELDPAILTGEAWEAIATRGFDPPALFAAYLHTLRWNCVTATDPRLFQAPFRAGIRLDAYQLEPLRKALLLPRVNLFIADDVGLGKTIEAGLIARELLLRKKVREIVVACPPSMLLQWHEELETRFGLSFVILDKEYLKRVRRERGFSVNPWSTHPRVLVSHRLLIDEAYSGPLRDWLGTFRSGSLFILDEAHHAAPASGQRYAIDSQMTHAVRDLAPRFEHRLFLSATPHNGHSNSFSALLEILDPQRFCRGIPVTPQHRDEVIVRRLKEDIRTIQGGFPHRHIVQLDIDGLPDDAPELQLAALLDQYRTLREERLQHTTRRTQAAAGLLITGLQQRLLSSIDAFARTLRVHRRTVQRQWDTMQDEAEATRLRASSLDLLTGAVDSDDERATLSEEDLQAEEEAQIEAASAATLGPLTDPSARAMFAREQQLLDTMTQVAEASRYLLDARVRRLLAWIRQHLCPTLGQRGAPWQDTRVILFTEYDDTKRYLYQQLEAAIAGSDRAEHRIAVYHGPTPPAQREEIKRAFNTDPARHPVRILIATDAAREGLNLQAHCSHLFHFDVPWNPSRMEQRNGRIDRKLQPQPEVFCHYFVYTQRPEDRILQALVRKTETIRQELGSLSQVIDAELAQMLRGGIRRQALARLEREILAADLAAEHRRAVDDELEAARERQTALRAQIDRLRTLLDISQKQTGIEEVPFRAAISCALELVGTTPLTPATGNGASPGPQRFVFPALDQRHGADPTWVETLDTLRTPRRRDQPVWEWRRTAPLRPVIFADAGTLDDDVVHLHLEQRVVQRLLGRFTAQGFVHHDLSRACLAQTSDAIPRVILLGRLCLYGPGAARLHEELVPVTARWTDPQIRQGPLAPYAREAEARTLTLLEQALVGAPGRPMPAPVQQQLQACAPQDVQELLPHLQARGAAYARDAVQQLTTRGDAEARAMQQILTTQQRHIAATVATHAKMDTHQLTLNFGDKVDELRQLEANKRYWARRLAMLDAELQTEPERIRAVYAVQATMTTATYTHTPTAPPVVRLRTGRLLVLLVLLLLALVGGGFWVLATYGKKVVTAPVESLVQPPWIKDALAYAPEPAAPARAAATSERETLLAEQLTALQEEVKTQRAALAALKRPPTTVPTQAPKAAPAAPAPAKAYGSMLHISHALKEATDGPKASEYTLAPGATKLPCILETTIISDVEGHFTCRVTTNVYDTATGRHLLVPQGSTVLGNDQANTLVYGSNRMDTVSLTLALPDGRTVDLGRAPVTDSQGVAGLTGDVNNHYVKLFGAVLIGGALKGGMSAFQIAAAESAGAGQVTAGVTALGNQATTRVVQPYINIRPTITVEAGALCTVLLLKPLHLPAMWQGTTHTATRR